MYTNQVESPGLCCHCRGERLKKSMQNGPLHVQHGNGDGARKRNWRRKWEVIVKIISKLDFAEYQNLSCV